MLTYEEIKEKYLNSKNVSKYNKFLLRSSITKIDKYIVSQLNPNDIDVNLKFVYWNPLTYIHLIVMLFINAPSYIWDGGIEKLFQVGKHELVKGFYDFI